MSETQNTTKSVEEAAKEFADQLAKNEPSEAFKKLTSTLKALPALPSCLTINETEIRLAYNNDPYYDEIIVDMERGIWETNNPMPRHHMSEEDPDFLPKTPQDFLRELIAAFSIQLGAERHLAGQFRAIEAGLPKN